MGEGIALSLHGTSFQEKSFAGLHTFSPMPDNMQWEETAEKDLKVWV